MRSQSTMTYKERFNLLKSIGIANPTSDMVWRVDDAIELARDGYVEFVKDVRGYKYFAVHSQSDENKVYHVHFNGMPGTFCDCPDWKKHDLADAELGIPFSFWVCKHGISARLYYAEMQAEQQADAIDVGAALDELSKLEVEHNAMVDQLSALKYKRDTIDMQISHIKRSLLAHMEATNQRRIETKTHKVSLAKLPMRIATRKPDDVDDCFKMVKTEVVIDKGKIARHVKDTGEIPNGIELLQKSYVRVQEVNR